MAFLVGMSSSQWMKLLLENKFAIDPKYIPRALFLTMLSLRNSILKKKENKLYASEIEKTTVKDPVFILGHWRSGTTLIHNLMALDESFAYPNLFQVTHPHCFIMREKMVETAMASAQPQKRPMDNLKVTFNSPGEDESAIAVMCTRSPIIAKGFYRNKDLYESFCTFEKAKKKDKEKWEESFLWFLKKLTWRYNKPLILKSPLHTGRIALMLSLFPNAKFVHIHRNPFVVYQSTFNLYKTLFPGLCFQETESSDWTSDIIRNYKTMYEAYFSQRSMIPYGNLVDICFEEVEKNTLGQMKYIYEKLNLGDFERVRPAMENYTKSQKEYKKNKYAKLPENIFKEIAKQWHRSFVEWGYPIKYQPGADEHIGLPKKTVN
ncbi:MAG: sulfotransferase [Bacteroidota bacterium]|nr:sulfotransferase [Bacteroidota bacterium]MDP4190697.1 sulfotransferase [Bacteroidota bacterium]MDP4196835.1 sulfotransferase [Bacteroidota bacterium]